MKIKKYDENPILTKESLHFEANSIFNPGAIKFNDKYILICRVEMPIGRSVFVKAESDDGVNFIMNDKPILTPDMHGIYSKYVEWGIEDTRITKIGEKHYLTYTGYSKYDQLVILAETTDFENFLIHGPISEPSNKDCSLFPEKIGGHYWKVDRPSSDNRQDIWISKSPDLIHWGGYRLLMEPKEGSWEQNKIGGSTPPIKTDKGWLMLYHGVRGFGISYMYKIGTVLLDLNEPWKVIGRSKEPFLIPEYNYERIGDVPNVVFTNGWIHEDNGEVKIYYSGADTNICLASTTIDELLERCK